MEERGLPGEGVRARGRKRRSLADDLQLTGKKRAHSEMEEDEEDAVGMAEDEEEKTVVERARSKLRDMSISRMEGQDPEKLSSKVKGEEGERMRRKIEKRLRKVWNVHDSDRKISVAKPKHLYSGKSSNGTAQRR